MKQRGVLYWTLQTSRLELVKLRANLSTNIFFLFLRAREEGSANREKKKGDVFFGERRVFFKSFSHANALIQSVFWLDIRTPLR